MPKNKKTDDYNRQAGVRYREETKRLPSGAIAGSKMAKLPDEKPPKLISIQKVIKYMQRVIQDVRNDAISTQKGQVLNALLRSLGAFLIEDKELAQIRKMIHRIEAKVDQTQSIEISDSVNIFNLKTIIGDKSPGKNQLDGRKKKIDYLKTMIARAEAKSDPLLPVPIETKSRRKIDDDDPIDVDFSEIEKS
jgi:hypothetical protein